MVKDLKLWQFIKEQLEQKQPVFLLCVMESKGSSPGRQGFKMAVIEKDMSGSVGGGIMEHKFVELAREMLKRHELNTLLKQQIHSKSASANQSGMICSGEQTLAVYFVKPEDDNAVNKILTILENGEDASFKFTPQGFTILPDAGLDTQYVFEKKSETDFVFTEKMGYPYRIHIVGGGHCALALSKLISDLNFYISVYDNREDLNTLEQNIYANDRYVVDYTEINKLIPESDKDFVAIMTFGYRTDGIVLRQLIHKKFRYLGLLGSKAKIEKMLQELRDEGIDEAKIKAIHTPIGLPIKSQTPEEIAISIAAEIIQVKNES